MNAVFATQGLGLGFHYQLAEALGPALPLERRGFYVSDSQFHRAFRAEVPAFGHEPHVLAEWEILKEARTAPADAGWLREREREMDAGPLWDALVCDRRMMQGRWCKERQDYRPRFTHEEFLRILTVSLRRIDRWFDAVRPDVMLAFVPVTFGEYLIWMVGQSRRVPGLYLYPTKIENYMCWMDSFFGRPLNIQHAYREYRAGLVDHHLAKAEAYLTAAESGSVRHEGMIPIPGTRPAAERRRRASITRLASAEYEYRTTDALDDNHTESPLLTQWHRRVLFPVRRRRVTSALRSRYVREAALEHVDYLFYPLHAEPEVALSIHGRPYVNQIETIRNLARSLPAGMLLVTKEHPRSIGYRPVSYYDKLLRVPNVRIVDPFVESKHVVTRAAGVAAVWSFVGFEAVLARRPVISLGTPLYTLLPESMVRHATDPGRMSEAIALAFSAYQYDRQALVSLVAACMNASVRLNFYSRFLQKSGRYGGDAQADEYEAFVRYTCARAYEAVGAVQRPSSFSHAGIRGRTPPGSRSWTPLPDTRTTCPLTSRDCVQIRRTRGWSRSVESGCAPI